LSSATIVRAANRGQIAGSEIVEDRFGLSLRRDLAIRLLEADAYVTEPRPPRVLAAIARSALVFTELGDTAAAAARTLSVTLGPTAFAGFFPDRAFVVRSEESPVDSFVLTGPSTLFDRLRHRQVRFVDDETAALGFDPFEGMRAASFAKLVAQGRRLFLKDDFDGNGRTCGTCHVESNNFTIDPELISPCLSAIRSSSRRPIRRWRLSRIPT
jgi:hypothetical protein